MLMANSKYTTEDFAKQARAQGAQNDLTQDDLTYASSNPDAGMALLGYLSDYKKASQAGNDAGAYLARDGIDRIRSGYSSPTSKAASSFSPAQPQTKPSYSSGDIVNTMKYMLGQNTSGTDANGDGKINARDIISMARNGTAVPGSSVSSPGQTSHPVSITPDRYADVYAKLLGEYVDGGVDVGSSDLYREYERQYNREAQRAADDILGRLAAAAGGRVSSAAASAAAQQQNYYMAQLNDRWSDIYNTLRGEQLQKLGLLRDAEQTAYDRAYNEEERDYNRTYNEEARDYNRRLSEATLGAQYGDYSGLGAMGIDTSRYLENEQYQKKLQEALYAAQYGDYTALDRMLGSNIAVTSKLDKDFDRNLNNALYAAQYGDYTALDTLLGSNITAIQKEQRDYERGITDRQLAFSEQQAALSAAKASASSSSTGTTSVNGTAVNTKARTAAIDGIAKSKNNRDMLKRVGAALGYGYIDSDEASYYIDFYGDNYDYDGAREDAVDDGAPEATTVTEAQFNRAKASGESWASQYDSYASYLYAMVVNGLGLSSQLYGIDSFPNAPALSSQLYGIDSFPNAPAPKDKWMWSPEAYN